MWMLWLCSFLLLGSAHASPQAAPAAAAAPRCRYVPGKQGWPSDADWATLNKAVNGRLLKPPPPAAGCHRNIPSQGAPSCAAVNAGFGTHEFHVNSPTSTLWQLWTNYSCPISANSPCTGSGYPVYVVAATNAAEVRAAVNFARTKNVRLNIKSTGHDFLGRSVQPYSLSIYMRGVKGTKWFDNNFIPAGCQKAIPGPVVTAGAGHIWGELYSDARRHGASVVGGYSDTVGLAGFLSNGGHGEMSAKYGYGTDMVLQIEVITANGDFITANECQNQDIFWAMRGGGGSTYGVGITYTLQAVKSGNLAKYTGFLNGWEDLYRVHANWNKLAAVGAGGYINGHPGRAGTISLTVYLANSTADRLRSLVRPVTSGFGGKKMKRDGESAEIPGKFYEYESYEAMREARTPEEIDQADRISRAVMAPSAKPATGTGENKIIASWLWSEKDVSTSGMRKALRGGFEDSNVQMMTDATMGFGTHKPPYLRGGGNAVNPAMRTAIMRVAAEIHWAGTSPTTLNTKLAACSRATASFRQLAPEGGTYANEADPTIKDWQRTFWGTNYPKLLEIKKKIDPKGVFYCRMCVGSELMEDNNGVLCHRQ